MKHDPENPSSGDPEGATGRNQINQAFRKFAQCMATACGSPWAFATAVLVIVAWAVIGPIFRFSDTWQLVINTATTIVTFLMVFLIQNTQNRDARAIQLKLDELIRAKKGARNLLVDLEDSTDEELLKIEREFKRIRERIARKGDDPEAVRGTPDPHPKDVEGQTRRPHGARAGQ